MDEKQKTLNERWNEENNEIIFLNLENEQNQAMKMFGLEDKE